MDVLSIGICIMEFCRTDRNTLQATLMSLNTRAFICSFRSFWDHVPCIYRWFRWAPQSFPEISVISVIIGVGFENGTSISRFTGSNHQVNSCRTWSRTSLFMWCLNGEYTYLSHNYKGHGNMWSKSPRCVHTIITGFNFRSFAIYWRGADLSFGR